MTMIVVNGLSVHQVITDAELYAIWPKIRDGINTIEKRCKGVFYRPEDCYHEIKSGTLQLLIASDVITGVYEGFALTQEMNYPDGKGLHIKAMHHRGIYKGFVDDLFDAIEVIAKRFNIMRISYSSSRKGWEKRTEHKGYKRIASIHYFEREIP